MKTQKILLFFLILILSFVWDSAFAAINFTLTPLKYEIEAEAWETISRTAQIRNNGPDTVTLTTASSDFEANGTDGTPRFVRKSELVYPDQQLSTWISIDRPEITLAPWETKWFNFDITIPTNASPGWHYGAVFFKNPSSESSTDGNTEIGINVDYGIILIVNVAGEIVIDVDIDDIIINSWWWGWSGAWWWGWASNIWQDNCPFWDLTSSNFDGKCIDNPFINNNDDFTENKDDENMWSSESENTNDSSKSPSINPDGSPQESLNPLDDFEVSFQLPINNNGNTHVKPEWKIKLIDENGKQIKGIGKEVKKNDYWAVIWEDIVDYLPLNDEWGNVLPKTKRNFETTWKGFPYKTYDDRWNPVIQYWKPWEYYTNKNLEDNRFKMPWERICEKRNTKIVQAIIELSYEDKDGEQVQYNSAEEFEIQYTEQYIGLNPYVIIPLLLFIFLWLSFWFIFAKRKVKCINKDCEQKLWRREKKCTECGTLQNKKTSKKSSIPVSKKKKWKKINKDSRNEKKKMKDSKKTQKKKK